MRRARPPRTLLKNRPVAASARAVNVTILLLVVLELASGLGGFLVGEPDGRWLFWLHRAGGLALVVLLFRKVGIAARSYRRRGLSFGTGLAAVGGVLFLGSLATGLLWTTAGLPRLAVPIFGSWTVLSLHVALSLLLMPLFLTHVRLRWPRPRRADMLGRRAALRLLIVLAAGLLLWGAREALSALVGTPGSAARRRFTGSREEASFAGNLHPVTNWLSDPVPRISPGGWRLRVHGEVERETALSYDEILALGGAVREATLDCTGGWYTVQRWDGVPMAALLGRAGAKDGARSILVRSSTGYARRFPLSEVGELLEATDLDALTMGSEPPRITLPGTRVHNMISPGPRVAMMRL